MLKKSIHSVALNGLTYRDIFIEGQLLTNGDFEDGTTGWTFITATGSVNNGIATFIANAQNGKLQQTFNSINGNKYYFNVRLKGDSTSVWTVISNPTTVLSHNGNNIFQNMSVILTSTSTTMTLNSGHDNRASAWTPISVDYAYAINLTQLFGSGNEPTKEAMDALFAEFQEAGAVAVGQFEQGQGKNLFDKSLGLEVGSINTTTGQDDAVTSRWRMKFSDLIEVAPNTNYSKSLNNSPHVLFEFWWYDANKTFISFSNNTLSPSNAKYMRVNGRNSNNTNITEQQLIDIANALQLEQGSVATAYEPYKYLSLHLPATNDVPVWTTNLFDKSVAILNFYIASSGQVLQSTILNQEFYDPTYHPINTGEQITVSQANAGYIRVAWYDSNQAFISRNLSASNATTYTVTAPANAKFFRISNDTVNLNSTQVEYGSVATTYRPYNLTLNEIFDDGNLVVNGDFSDGTTGWSAIASTNSVTNQIMANTGDGALSSPVLRQSSIFTIGQKYYIKLKIRVTNNLASSMGINEPFTALITSPIENQWYEYSFINNATTTNLWLRHYYSSASTANGKVMQVDGNYGVYGINLTSLGIASLTQAEMDALYERYTRNKERTLLANTLIQHDQNSVPIADLNGLTLDEVFDRRILTDVTALPNGVKYYEVSGGNIVQRVKEYELKASDITSISSNASVQYISYKKQTDGLFPTSGGGINVVLAYLVNGFQSISNTIAVGYNFEFSTTLMGLGFNLNTYANLAAAQADLAGTQILYQLATPITITSGVSITQAQLDYWFSVWQQNHKLGMRVHRASGNDVPIYTRNLFDKSLFVTTYLYDRNVITGSLNNPVILYDDFTPNTQYTIQGYLYRDNNLGEGRFRIYYTDATFTEVITTSGYNWQYKTLTSTSGKSIDYIALLTSASNGTVRADIDTLQIEQGSTATDYITHSYTLNEVFRDGQLVSNGDFINGTTGWGASGTTLSVSNGIMEATSTIINTAVGFNLTTSLTLDNSLFYFIQKSRVLENANTFRVRFNNSNTLLLEFPNVNSWYTLSLINNMTSFQGVRFNSLQVGAKTQYEFIYLYNLTSLGLASLTKAQLDYLFTVWQFNNANAVVARQFIQTANIDTVAYGGLSYREIFEDGQLVTNGDVGWVANTYAYLSPVTLNLTTNDKIYLRYTQETLSGDNINAAGRWTLFNLSTFNNIVSSQYNNGTYSYLHTAIRTANELLYTYGNQSVGGQIKYNNIFIINLTDLFGAGNEPNQATMDTLYQEYITLKGGLQ